MSKANMEMNSDTQGTIWWSASDLEEAERWKTELLGKGALAVILKPEEDRPIVDVQITLERTRAAEILGYEPDEEEWLYQ